MADERKLVYLASFSHFITHGYMTLLPAVLVVIAADHSMSFMDIGIIANIGYFLYGLGAFPAGHLADKYGSKRVLTVGVFGMAISSMLVGLSPTVITFGIAYGILGCFASIHHPAGLSLIARRIKSKKGNALGIHGFFGNVGLFLTPLFASSCILLFNSWRAAYIIFGVIGVVFALMIYFARIDSEPDFAFSDLRIRKKSKGAENVAPIPLKAEESQQPQKYVIPVSLLLLFVGSVLSGFIFRGSLTFFPALFQREIHFITNHDEPVVMAGFFTTGVLSLGLISSWFGGYINDKIKRPELFPMLLFVAVAPALYLISRFSDNSLVIAAAFFSLFFYAWQPSQNYLIAKYTKKASHGKGFGISFFLIFGVGSIAASSGGYVADNYGIDRFYWFMSIVALLAIAAAGFVYLFRRYQFHFSGQLVRDEGNTIET
jgi:sugar phosphate permease